jgi:HAD superfamily hydrolase (TIGR01509 family)
MSSQPGLVIFDCDGVLVDSEPLSIRVLVDGLATIGYAIDEATAYERFLGRSLSAVQGMLRDELGFDLPTERLEAMRVTLFDRYRRELRAIPGVVEALDQLTIPYCVASSSLPERIRVSLEVTGLLPRFESHIFSATMVSRGKPAPDLFLHAAGQMGVPADACLVIEDSAPGIAAALNAGMRAFAFVGGSHARQPGYAEQLAVVKPELMFDDLLRLPDIIEMARLNPTRPRDPVGL